PGDLQVGRRRARKRSVPSAASVNTPSRNNAWLCTLSWRPEPKRWITVTEPEWPPAHPARRARRLCQPSTARTNTPSCLNQRPELDSVADRAATTHARAGRQIGWIDNARHGTDSDQSRGEIQGAQGWTSGSGVLGGPWPNLVRRRCATGGTPPA